MNLAHFRTLALVLAVAWPIAGPSALRAATILVTTNLDSGIGSFRDAIDLANATAGTDDIVFNLVNLVSLGEIELLTALSPITESVNLDASALPDFLGVVGPDMETWLDIGDVDVLLRDLDVSGQEFSVASGGSLEIRRSEAFELDIDLTGDGGFVKSGSAELTLVNPNSYTGGTAVQGGSLRGDTRSLQGDIEVESGTSTIFEMALAAAAEADRVDSGTYAGILSGAGELRKAGEGTLILTGDNTFTGGTTVEAGKLIASEGALPADGDVQVDSGGTLELADAGAATFSGAISGAGDVIKSGSGALLLEGANTSTGSFTIRDGDVSVGDAGNLAAAVDIGTGRDFTIIESTSKTFSGSLTGGGQLTKEGGGTLTLTGTADHTGGTEVIAGTLRGNTSNLQGAINLINSATALEFDQSVDGAFSGTITTFSAMETVTKLGAGTLTIASPQTYTATTTVAAGRLELAASLTGPVEVNSGATLGGTSSVGGLVTVHGSVAPTGTATLSLDSVQFEAGSTLAVDVAADGSSGRVSGTSATVDGGMNGAVIRVNPGPGNYTAGKTFTVLATPTSDRFADVVDDFPFLDITDATPAGNSPIRIHVVTNASAISEFATTPNQIAVSGALEDAYLDPTADFLTVIDNLQVVTEEDLPTVLDDLAADELVGLHAVRIASQYRFESALRTRFQVARDELVNGDLAARESPSARRLPRLRSFHGSGPSRTLAATPAPLLFARSPEDDDLGAWFDFYGVFGDRSGRNHGSKHLDYDLFGPTAGADWRLRDDVLVGGSLGYTRGSLETASGNGRGTANLYHAALYTAYLAPRFLVGGAFRYAYADLETQRRIAFEGLDRTATGTPDGHDLSAFLEAAATQRLPWWDLDLEPVVSVSYARSSQDAFTETGAGSLDLEIDEQIVESLQSQLAVRVSGRSYYSNGFQTRTALRLGWYHEYSDTQRSVRANLTGAVSGGNFSVRGADTGRDGADIGIDWEAGLAERSTLSFAYGARVTSDAVDHGFAVALRLLW